MFLFVSTEHELYVHFHIPLTFSDTHSANCLFCIMFKGECVNHFLWNLLVYTHYLEVKELWTDGVETWIWNRKNLVNIQRWDFWTDQWHDMTKAVGERTGVWYSERFIFLYFQLDTPFFRLRTISAILFPLHASGLTGPSSGGPNCTCCVWYSPPLQMSLSCGRWERTSFSTAARQRHLQRGRIPYAACTIWTSWWWACEAWNM